MIQKHLISFCLALALLFLLIAAFLYPGGSQASLETTGFDMANNYLCNLFNAEALNGTANPGQIWAYIGMFFMCLGFGTFFYRVSFKIPQRSASMIIRYAGMASMFFSFWVITPYHDLMVTIACIFAMLALFYLFVFVMMSPLRFLKIIGTACLFMLYFNAFVYYFNQWLEILPIAQKVNYLLLIIWVLGLEYTSSKDDFVIRKKEKK